MCVRQVRDDSNSWSKESDSGMRCATTEFSVLYRIVRIAQHHPTRRYHISLRSLTTALKEPNQRCTTDANRWKCVSDRRAGHTLRVLLALRVVPQGEARGTMPTPMQPRNPRRARPPPDATERQTDQPTAATPVARTSVAAGTPEYH